jgi:hypothetical protein
MPKSISRVDPDSDVNLAVRVPGWLKNEVVEYLEGSGESLSQWFVSVLQRALREGWGVPEPPRAVRPLPSTGDEVRAWAAGDRLLGPCGEPADGCVGVRERFEVSGLVFCSGCSIRLG